jgi:N,N'-diacetyllegionaminate synthase
VRSFPRFVEVGKRRIGEGEPCYVIAEAGVNHNGDVELARRLVDAAAEAGADAVKFQTFRPEALTSEQAPKAAYQITSTSSEESQFSMLKRLTLPANAYAELKRQAEVREIEFLSTPFDSESARLLNDLDVVGFKVSSGDLTDLDLLRQLAESGRPMILSTGMAYLGEVEDALRVIEEGGRSPVVLLHCVSNYPADPLAVNLRAIETLQRAFGVPVGFSDHTLGTEIVWAAVALGACVVEKHLTLDRTMSGPDHQASMEPAQLREMIRGIRQIELALGDGRKVPHPSEMDVRVTGRKSIVANRTIPQGTRLTREMLTFKRPGTGLPPSNVTVVVGRRTVREILADRLIAWDDLA